MKTFPFDYNRLYADVREYPGQPCHEVAGVGWDVAPQAAEGHPIRPHGAEGSGGAARSAVDPLPGPRHPGYPMLLRARERIRELAAATSPAQPSPTLLSPVFGGGFGSLDKVDFSCRIV